MEQKPFTMMPVHDDGTWESIPQEVRLIEMKSLIGDMRRALTEYYREPETGMMFEHVINKSDWDAYLMRIEDHLDTLFPQLQ